MMGEERARLPVEEGRAQDHREVMNRALILAVSSRLDPVVEG
jgi:hypothetical protein